MANTEQLKIVHQEVEVWNRWRENTPDEAIDLEKANLEGAKLALANLNGANLIGADLFGADLSRAKLIKTDLNGADLTCADLNNAECCLANLRNANLSYVDLRKADLSEANLSGADLSEANLKGANLEGANLEGANLEGANLMHIRLGEGVIAIQKVIHILKQSKPGEDEGIHLDTILKRQMILNCLVELLHVPAVSNMGSEDEKLSEWANDVPDWLGFLAWMLIFPFVFMLVYVGIKHLMRILYQVIRELLSDCIGGLLRIPNEVRYYLRQLSIYFIDFKPTRKDIIERLKRARQDPNYRVRWKAAYELEEVGREQVIALLTQVVKTWSRIGRKITDDDVMIFRKAAYGLVKIGGEKTFELLVQITQDYDDAEVRWAAVFGLGEMSGEKVIKPLSRALHDADVGVRGAAVLGLGKIGGAEVLGPLAQALHDAHAKVRWAAKYTLRKIVVEIRIVFFGDKTCSIHVQNADWCNPRVAEDSVALIGLQHIVVDTETYDVRLLEKFMTYAVNALGQNYLKKCVTVYLYGNLAQKHPNTYNLLANQCLKIITEPCNSAAEG